MRVMCSGTEHTHRHRLVKASSECGFTLWFISFYFKKIENGENGLMRVVWSGTDHTHRHRCVTFLQCLVSGTESWMSGGRKKQRYRYLQQCTVMSQDWACRVPWSDMSLCVHSRLWWICRLAVQGLVCSAMWFSLFQQCNGWSDTNFNVFGFWMMHRVLSHLNGACVVAVYGSLGEVKAVIKHLILNPHNLRTAAACCYVLCLCCWASHWGLLLARPAD